MNPSAASETVLTVDDLGVVIPTPRGISSVVRGMNLRVQRGRAVGIVGESGCGKTMTGRAILRLLPRNAIVTGKVVFNDIELLSVRERDLGTIRGRKIAMIFQDPSAALNPVFTIGQQVKLVLGRHRVVDKDALDDKAVELLTEVGLPSPSRLLKKYPHELSGGMQQRVMIAMAVSTKPELLIADEPTTALDVTIQAQVLDLLTQLRETYDMAVLLITHSVSVVEQACQDIVVVYAGRAVERGPVQGVLADPRHPYTRALLGAQPQLRRRGEPLGVIPGAVPSTFADINGCAFSSRCPHTIPLCYEKRPAMVADRSAAVACHLYQHVA